MNQDAIAKAAKKKNDLGDRLRTAIRLLERRAVSRPEKNAFEHLISCVNPSLAFHEDRDAFLSVYPRTYRGKCRNNDKLAVVIHEVSQVIKSYWSLVRVNHDAFGLERRIRRIEDYAKYGFDNCDLIGSETTGYSLFIPPELREEN